MGYEYVCEWWNDVADLEDDDESGTIPEKPPKNKAKAIELYFNNHKDFEQYTLNAHDLDAEREAIKAARH